MEVRIAKKLIFLFKIFAYLIERCVDFAKLDGNFFEVHSIVFRARILKTHQKRRLWIGGKTIGCICLQNHHQPEDKAIVEIERNGRSFDFEQPEKSVFLKKGYTKSSTKGLYVRKSQLFGV